MSNTRVKVHPTLGILVCTDGHVMVPATKFSKAHWTYGCKTVYGYLQVRINGKPYKVHRLVLEAFVGPCPDGMECDHINRCRSANFLANLRWVSRTQNQRNTKANDRVESRGGTHSYDDYTQYCKEQHALYRAKNKAKERYRSKRYYAEHPEKWREKQEHNKQYRNNKINTHRVVRFSDGSKHWLPNEEAESLFAIPVKQRIFKG